MPTARRSSGSWCAYRSQSRIDQLQKMKAGSRIVSHDFDMEGVIPDKTLTVLSKEDNEKHTLYLWTVPLKKEK